MPPRNVAAVPLFDPMTDQRPPGSAFIRKVGRPAANAAETGSSTDALTANAWPAA